jgi:hypothetical protein
MDELGWLRVLREVFERDDTGVPDALRSMTGVEALGWVLSVEFGPSSLEKLQPLVDTPGGERIYHAAVALTQAPPHASKRTFEEAGETAPTGHQAARYLTRLRDYATKGEKDRHWFYQDGKLYSVDRRGRVAREIDDADTFARALAAALS